MAISRSVMEATKISIRQGPGRPTQQASAARREKILSVGSRLIYEQGYHGTSIRDIVGAVGIPKGSFYNYFASKEEFVVEALEFHTRKRFNEFTAPLEDDSNSPVQRLIESFRNNPDGIATDEFTPMSFLTKVSIEVGKSIPAIAETSWRLFSEFRDAIASCIDFAQQAGEVSSDEQPEKLATFILFSWYGAMLCTRNKETDADYPQKLFCEVLERDILV